jgi:hypothetical protein
MKRVYEYATLIALNQALGKFERDGYEVCVKLVGSKPSFFLVADDEKDEKEEENGEESEPVKDEEPEESPEAGDTEKEGETEKKE